MANYVETYLHVRVDPDADWRILEHTAGRAGVILQDTGTVDPAFGPMFGLDVLAEARRQGYDAIALPDRVGVDLAAWADSEPAVLAYAGRRIAVAVQRYRASRPIAEVHYVACGRIACGEALTCTATLIRTRVTCPDCLDKIAELSPDSDRDATREDLDRPFDFDRDGVE